MTKVSQWSAVGTLMHVGSKTFLASVNQKEFSS